jgi:hypothetical protein
MADKSHLVGFYRITIPAFHRWQPKTDKRRSWVALDRGFFDDPKIQSVMLERPDAPLCYLALLLLASSDGTIELTLRALRREWTKATGTRSPRFDVEGRLALLENAGLVVVQNNSKSILNDPQNRSKSAPNDLQNDSKGPFARPESQSGLEAGNSYIQYRQDTPDKDSLRESKSEVPTGKGTPEFPDAKSAIWAKALQILTRAGQKESKARSIIGRWLKDYGS